MNPILTSADSKKTIETTYQEVVEANNKQQRLESNTTEKITQLIQETNALKNLKTVTNRSECVQLFTALCLSQEESTRNLVDETVQTVLQSCDLMQNELIEERKAIRETVLKKGEADDKLTQQEEFLAKLILQQGAALIQNDPQAAWRKIGALNLYFNSYFPEQWREVAQDSFLLNLFSDTRKFNLVTESPAWGQVAGSIEEKMATYAKSLEAGKDPSKLLEALGAENHEQAMNTACSALEAQQNRDDLWKKLGVKSHDQAIKKTDELKKTINQRDAEIAQLKNANATLSTPKPRRPWVKRSIVVLVGGTGILGVLAYFDLRRGGPILTKITAAALTYIPHSFLPSSSSR